jgi:hypothetical protein
MCPAIYAPLLDRTGEKKLPSCNKVSNLYFSLVFKPYFSLVGTKLTELFFKIVDQKSPALERSNLKHG